MKNVSTNFREQKMNERKGDVTSDGSFSAKQQKPRTVTSNPQSRNLKFRQPRNWRWNKYRTNPDDKKFQPKFREHKIATTLEFKETQVLHTNRSWCKRTPPPLRKWWPEIRIWICREFSVPIVLKFLSSTSHCFSFLTIVARVLSSISELTTTTLKHQTFKCSHE